MTTKKKQQYRIRNWREYNRALVSRGSLTLWIDTRSTNTWLTSVVKALAEHKRHQLEERMKTGSEYQNRDIVFATNTGGPLERRHISSRNFKRVLGRAKLPANFRLYDLRHSCATSLLLLAANENPKIVSERLGHSSVVITLDTYSHVLPSMQRAASEQIENMLFTKSGTREAHKPKTFAACRGTRS